MFISFFDFAVFPTTNPGQRLKQKNVQAMIMAKLSKDYLGYKEITNIWYKLNRSIGRAKRMSDDTAFLTKSSIRNLLKDKFIVSYEDGYEVRTETPSINQKFFVIHDSLSKEWMTEDQKKATIAILLFIETMPYYNPPAKSSLLKNLHEHNDFILYDSDDAYLILLLPFLEQILFNLRVRFLEGEEMYLQAFETLKEMFMVRLKLGFGKYGKEFITGKELSLLARQNNLKSIQNSISLGKLRSSTGRGPSQLVTRNEAARWLTKDIKNRLIEFNWFEDGEALNYRTGMEYLSYFNVKYYQILCLGDLSKLANCPETGVYQVVDVENNQNIYTGYSEKNLSQRLINHFVKNFEKVSTSKFYGPSYHILIYAPLVGKSDLRNPVWTLKRCKHLETQLLGLAKPLF